MKGFFVAGTDTGVGKTEIARALCTLLRLRGMRPVALKPVETGCERDAPQDALALRDACGSTQTLDEVCPYRFRLPAAPLVAAVAEGAEIDLPRIEQMVARAASPIVVEAAGGLLVPFARAPLLLDEVDPADRAPARAIVTHPFFPTIVERELARRGLDVIAVVLNRTAAEDDPSVATNARWVAELTGARVLGPGPFVADAAIRPDILAPFLAPLVH